MAYMPDHNSDISETISKQPDIPERVKVGDILIARYTPFSGTHVTPEDLIESKRSAMYHRWLRKNHSH